MYRLFINLSIVVLCSALPIQQAFAQQSSGSSPQTNTFDPIGELKSEVARLAQPALAPPRTSLRVTATHNDYFPPLPNNLRPGMIFDYDNMAQYIQPGKSLWYEVPKWLAGNYSYGDMTTYSEKNLRTGEKSHPHEVEPALPLGRDRGIITDDDGNIWQKAYGTSLSDPNDSNTSAVKQVKWDDEITGIIISPTEYVENSSGCEFDIDRASKKILQVERWQRQRDFESNKDGTVAVTLIDRIFDTEGNPIYQVKARGSMIKRKDYVPLAPGGKDDVAGTYAEALTDLKKFLADEGKTVDLPAN
ncbi:MAG TPA: hypothetical protein V6C69_02740 [Trichormus sp.]|jgi:hypothetical protein